MSEQHVCIFMTGRVSTIIVVVSIRDQHTPTGHHLSRHHVELPEMLFKSEIWNMTVISCELSTPPIQNHRFDVMFLIVFMNG